MRFSLVVATMAALIPTLGHAAGKITLALSDNAPPLMATDGGILGDIIDEAIARIGGDVEVEIQSMPWARAAAMVEAGQADGLVGTYYRPKVRPWLPTYSTPITEDNVTIYCREGIGEETWSYPADFAGLTIGRLTGASAAGEAYFKMVEAGEITDAESVNVTSGLKMLKAGRTDCYVNSPYAVIAEMPKGDYSGIRPVTNVKMEHNHIGFNTQWMENTYAAEFVASFDSAIKEMQSDGTIEQITADYLSR